MHDPLMCHTTLVSVPLDDVALNLLENYRACAEAYSTASKAEDVPEAALGDLLMTQVAAGMAFLRHMLFLAVAPLYTRQRAVLHVTVRMDGKRVDLKRAVRKIGFQVEVLRAYIKQREATL